MTIKRFQDILVLFESRHEMQQEIQEQNINEQIKHDESNTVFLHCDYRLEGGTLIVFSMARTALCRGQHYGCWRYHPGHEIVEEVTASTDSLECRQQHKGHCTANTKQFKHHTSLGGTASHPEVTGTKIVV